MNNMPRPELLAMAMEAGARITGKPDASEPIEVVFSIEAWHAFDAALASCCRQSPCAHPGKGPCDMPAKAAQPAAGADADAMRALVRSNDGLLRQVRAQMGIADHATPPAPQEAQPAPQQGKDSYEDLWNALQAIDTAAVFLPGFEVRHEGGIEAVTRNIVEAMGRVSAAQPAPQQGEAKP